VNTGRTVTNKETREVRWGISICSCETKRSKLVCATSGVCGVFLLETNAVALVLNSYCRIFDPLQASDVFGQLATQDGVGVVECTRDQGKGYVYSNGPI